MGGMVPPTIVPGISSSSTGVVPFRQPPEPGRESRESLERPAKSRRKSVRGLPKSEQPNWYKNQQERQSEANHILATQALAKAGVGHELRLGRIEQALGIQTHPAMTAATAAAVVAAQALQPPEPEQQLTLSPEQPPLALAAAADTPTPTAAKGPYGAVLKAAVSQFGAPADAIHTMIAALRRADVTELSRVAGAERSSRLGLQACPDHKL